MLQIVKVTQSAQKHFDKLGYSLVEAVYCPALTPPDNGTVSISSGVNYSCDQGHALLGSTTRTCEDPDRDSVGTWTGSVATCQGEVLSKSWIINVRSETHDKRCNQFCYVSFLSVIVCPALSAPDNGTIVISTTSQLLGVGTTATYSCDPGYVLVGETTRTCEDTHRGATGTWSGTMTTCM